MSRSIDAIWRTKAAERLSIVADSELNDCATLLAEHTAELRSTAREKKWQQHYDLALEVCRLARRIRFGFVEPESFDDKIKDRMIELLTKASSAINTDANTDGIVLQVKNLNEIKENVEYRLARIAEESDDPYVNSEFPATS